MLIPLLDLKKSDLYEVAFPFDTDNHADVAEGQAMCRWDRYGLLPQLAYIWLSDQAYNLVNHRALLERLGNSRPII